MDVMAKAIKPGFYGGKLREPGDEPFRADREKAEAASWMEVVGPVPAAADEAKPKAGKRKGGKRQAAEPEAGVEAGDSGGAGDGDGSAGKGPGSPAGAGAGAAD